LINWPRHQMGNDCRPRTPKRTPNCSAGVLPGSDRVCASSLEKRGKWAMLPACRGTNPAPATSFRPCDMRSRAVFIGFLASFCRRSRPCLRDRSSGALRPIQPHRLASRPLVSGQLNP
jgi:hypothetical protein